MSTFGTHFRVTTFGESHCKGVGCIIDGCPPGLALTEDDIQPQLTRRRPGQSNLTTPVGFFFFLLNLVMKLFIRRRRLFYCQLILLIYALHSAVYLN
jgi:hypothetical protein